MMRHRDLYAKTIAKWGDQAQYAQAVEECLLNGKPARIAVLLYEPVWLAMFAL